jgi:aldose 1-epimerase
LIPWPNRLADGRYTFDGVEYQVPITEPERSNAIHGLLRWQNWRVVSHERAEVVVGNVLHPRTGYPFTLDVRVGYRLDADGLTVTTTATNMGRTPAPWAVGAHPYLSPGEGLIDDCELQFAAAVRVDTDERRRLPIGQLPTAGTEYDFGVRHRIGTLVVDDAFRDVERDSAGRAWVRLTGSDGRCAQLWVDDSYTCVQLFTGDTLAPPRRRRGLGAEPMSAPPNAFATGDGVIRLLPGATVTHRWGVQLAETG